MKTGEVLDKAKELTAGDREATHGDKKENHQNIADQWNAFLGERMVNTLKPVDVALMMVLLKVARTKTGAHNPDDYTDMAGYAAISGELADNEDMG